VIELRDVRERYGKAVVAEGLTVARSWYSRRYASRHARAGASVFLAI
jgi:hypothetical protein